jgi:hypothetical protein
MWQRAPEPFHRALFRLTKALANGSSPPPPSTTLSWSSCTKRSKAPLVPRLPPAQSLTPGPYRFPTPTPKR